MQTVLGQYSFRFGIVSFVFSSLLLSSVLCFPGSNVKAEELNPGIGIVDKNQMPIIDWEREWEAIDSGKKYEENVNFSSTEGEEGELGTLAFRLYATGSTSISAGGSTMSSIGKTSGKVIGTVVTATTALRADKGAERYAQGPTKTAIGKLTATSTATLNRYPVVGPVNYEGLTVHSATRSGFLYEKRSAMTGSY